MDHPSSAPLPQADEDILVPSTERGSARIDDLQANPRRAILAEFQSNASIRPRALSNWKRIAPGSASSVSEIIEALWRSVLFGERRYMANSDTAPYNRVRNPPRIRPRFRSRHNPLRSVAGVVSISLTARKFSR